MVGRFIKELVEGSAVDGVFVLRDREMRSTRAGEAYLSLELSDRSGSLPAVLFRPSRRACAVPTGSVVRASGTITSFRGVRRISLDTLTAAEEWDPDDLIGSSARPREELVAEMKELVGAVSNQSMRRLLRATFGDREFFDRFCRCPASQDTHHAYAGGLLEHTVAVASACLQMADRYPDADRDLLIASALLHDVGMVDALTFEAGIGMTDRGRFIGPKALSLLRVHRAASQCRLDEAMLLRVEHAVLAVGSAPPGSPVTLETVLLERLDHMDRDAAGYCQSVSAATAVEERWVRSGGATIYAPNAA